MAHDSIVDGPGLRLTVFCQGCTLRCPGCHNPGTHPLDGGREVQEEELIELIEREPLATGLTLSGGEPTLQPASCAVLAAAARRRGWDVWCYSGHTWASLTRRMQHEPDLRGLFDLVDVCVAGPYLCDQRTLAASWRGSANQHLVDVPASLTRDRLVPLSPAARG